MVLIDCHLAASDAYTEKYFVSLFVEERDLFLCSFPKQIREYPQIKQIIKEQRLAEVTTSSQILLVFHVKLVASSSTCSQWHLQKEVLLSKYSRL